VGVAAVTRTRIFPLALGIGTLAAAILAVEVLIRIGVINRFIVPLPSQIAPAFERVIIEEDIAERFRLTFLEALAAGVMITLIGVSMGVVLYRLKLLRDATETWIAALASAPIVLMYPLFLVVFGRNAWTIIMMGFVAGLPPVILKTIEGLAGTRRVLINVGRSFNLTGPQLFIKVLMPAALPTIFVGVRLGLIFTLINVVGVEFLINFGGLGQLINDLAERYDLPGTYAAICFVILVSVCFFVLTEWIERRPIALAAGIFVAAIAASEPTAADAERWFESIVSWFSSVARWPEAFIDAIIRLSSDPANLIRLLVWAAALAAMLLGAPWLRPVTLLRLGIIFAISLVWEFLALSGWLYQDVVPPLEAIATAVWGLLTTIDYYGNLAVTAGEVGAGLAIGGLSGIVVGLVLGTNRTLSRSFEPYLYYLGPTPKIIFFPVMIMWFGVAAPSKEAMGAISCFFPVALSVAAAARQIDDVLVRVGHSFRANAWQMATKIYLPAMRHPVINGVRLGLGVAIIGTLLAETKLSSRGVGFLIIQAYSLFDMPRMYAMLTVLFVVAIGANALVGRLGGLAAIRQR
jgi:NitT/TauT family transport system permease protein